MGLIDRYVFVSYVRVFLICFGGLFGMYVVGDFVNNLTEFLDLGRRSGSLLHVLSQHYGPSLPWFFDMTSPIAGLIASVFTVTWLQRYSELTALMAGGITRWRIVRPLMIASLLVAGLAAANREYVIPRVRQQLSQTVQDRLGGASRQMYPHRDRLTQIFLAGDKISFEDQTISGPQFDLPSGFGPWGSQLRADTAIRLEAEGDRPAGYLLDEVSFPESLERLPAIRSRDQPVLIGPYDADWLGPRQLFVACEIPLALLAGEASTQRFAAAHQLVRDLRNPSIDLGRDVTLALHARFVQPLLDVALAVAGLCVVLARVASNVFLASGNAMLIVALQLGITAVAHGLGLSYVIPVYLAAWLPALIMVPVAAVLVDALWR